MEDEMKPVYRVITAISPPYVMYNRTSGAFYGLCVDLLKNIASLVGFDYTIKELTTYSYQDSVGNNWNGMIDELINNGSDIAIGPIWVTSNRTKAVDFTIPYQGLSGYTIMMLKSRPQSSFFKFVTILDPDVWIGITLAFLFTVFLLYIFERYSPFSHRNNRKKYRNERNCEFSSFKECLWFTFSAFTFQGSSDIPKNVSGKIVVMTWWLFGFVTLAAYTANLAAYETLDRLGKDIESLDDLRRQYRVEYSTVLDSAAYRYFSRMKNVEQYFERYWKNLTMSKDSLEKVKSEYVVWDYPLDDKFTKMYSAMAETGFIPSVDEAVKMIRSGNRTYEFALIAEAMIIKYLTLTNCDLKQVGEEFAKRPFSFAVQKNSPLTEKFDDAITRLRIEGRLNEVETKWWDENPLKADCPKDTDFNAGFGLNDLAFTFLMILLGGLLSSLILCLQYCWYCYQLKRRAKKVRLFVRTRVTFPFQ